MGGSRHDGEALNAVRLADRMIREVGLTWEDLLAPYAQLQIAVEAARVLLDENTSLQAELERQRTNGGFLVEWREVGTVPESRSQLVLDRAGSTASFKISSHPCLVTLPRFVV